MPAIYDNIGDAYGQTRRADERIVQRIEDLLGLPGGSRILDVSAGSGNYSLALADRGFEVSALEPSRERWFSLSVVLESELAPAVYPLRG